MGMKAYNGKIRTRGEGYCAAAVAGSCIILLTLALSCAYSPGMDYSAQYNQDLAHYTCYRTSGPIRDRARARRR